MNKPRLARFRRDSDLVVLGSSVLAFVVMTLVLLRADTVVYDGTNHDDVGPFDGVNAFLVVVAGVLFGLLPLVLAIWPSRPRRVAAWIAVYTGVCGAITTPAWIHLTAETDRDRRIDAAALAEATRLYWVAGLVALVPLVLFLCSARRSEGVTPNH